MVSKDNTVLHVTVSKVNESKLNDAATNLGLSKSALVGLILTSILTFEGGKVLGDIVGGCLTGKDGSNG